MKCCIRVERHEIDVTPPRLQAEIPRKIERHQNARRRRSPSGTRAKSRQSLRKARNDGKRRILDFIFSNGLWKNGRLIATHKKPFDILALTKVAYEDKKAASQVKNGLFENWLPGRDSNPRPIGYKCPDISARLGLSHHPPDAGVGRCGGLLGGVLNL